MKVSTAREENRGKEKLLRLGPLRGFLRWTRYESLVGFRHKPSRLRAPRRGRERSTGAHGASNSYFGVQFSASAFYLSNFDLFGWIPLSGRARGKRKTIERCPVNLESKTNIEIAY